MDVTMLLGAGVSVAVGMPCTRQITEAILSGDGFWFHTDGTIQYDPSMRRPKGPPLDPDDREGALPFCTSFLSGVRDTMNSLLGDDDLTYEDLYYAADTLLQGMSRVNADAVAESFWLQVMSSLTPETRVRIERYRRDGNMPPEYNPLDYIGSAVAGFLSYRQDRLGHLTGLEFFGDLARDSGVDSAHLFTLNHDMVLENYLTSQGLGYLNGVSKQDGEFTWIDPRAYSGGGSRGVQLVKLHGSLDWHWYKRMHSYEMRCGVRHPPSPYGTDGRGCCWEHMPEPPNILVGTLNKFRSYQHPPFLDLLYLFHERLAHSHKLVVCGHSFCDEGIMAHVMNWVRSDVARGVFFIDPRAEELKQKLVHIDINEAGIQAMACGIEKVEWKAVKDWLSA